MPDPILLQRVIASLSARWHDATQPLQAATPLSDTLLMDSLSVLEIIMMLEEQFGVRFETSDLDRLGTPGDIASLIAEKTAGA